MVSAPARRQQVAYARTRGVSERRACALMSVARSALHYESRLIKKDAAALAAMSILSAQYPYWTIRPFTLFHGERGWKLQRGDGLEDVLQVRGMVLPGLLLVLGLTAKGRVVLPVPSDIQPGIFRELRLRLGALPH